jgi:hypothetical protein
MSAAALLPPREEQPLYPLCSGDLLPGMARVYFHTLDQPGLKDPCLRDLQWCGAAATLAQVLLVDRHSEGWWQLRRVLRDLVGAVERGRPLLDASDEAIRRHGRKREIDLGGAFYPSAAHGAILLAEQALAGVHYYSDLDALAGAWASERSDFSPAIAHEPVRLATLIVNTMRRELARVDHRLACRAGRQEQPPPMAHPDVTEPTAEQQYRVVRLPGGTIYTFTPAQAECVKVLWEAWEEGRPEMRAATILDRAKVENESLAEVFRQRRNGVKVPNPAWGALIVEDDKNGKGWYRLSLPPKRTTGATRPAPGLLGTARD